MAEPTKEFGAILLSASRLSSVMTDRSTRTLSSLTPSLSDVEQRPARYLFAIASIASTDEGPVPTGALQERLGVSQPSVTEMVSRLNDRGLVDHEKYRGVTLTARGGALAREMGWRVCIVSSFFESELGTRLDEDAALDVGLALPEDGVRRMRDRVDASCLDLCPEASADGERCAV